MTNLITPTIAITLSRIRTTDPASGIIAPHLVGIGLFHIAECAPDAFDVTVATRAVPAGSDLNDAVLIRWLTDQLSEPAAIVGWQLSDTVVPALLAASTNASPREDRALVDALSIAVGTGAVDLADRFGGAAAPSFHGVCAGGSIDTIEPVAGMLAATEPAGEGKINAMLAANATAVVRLWANGMPDRAVTLHRMAVDALDAWRGVAAGTAKN